MDSSRMQLLMALLSIEALLENDNIEDAKLASPRLYRSGADTLITRPTSVSLGTDF